MKKPSLIITKVNNDVVVTSGSTCAHETALGHLYVTGPVNNWDYPVIEYKDDPKTGTAKTVSYSLFENKLATSGKWYYTDGTEFKECDGSHSDYNTSVN